ncbi:thiamine pyrophosphate-binding protein [Rhodospirillum sp. A1_3_36]|uniref:thiamine pyrophosphate-binding protein n=1 Tax=Rhodospirillum sp. A1_3_36 TaxID=3391666 RepID=UPI0039A4B112
MRVGRYLAEFLVLVGVRRVYQLSGGMIAPLLDAIGEHSDIELVNMAHEQAAGFAADAEARLTGIPGVAMGTSGPGALNLVTAIAMSHYDSVPMIYIGGQVQTYLRATDRPTRQMGLQECPFDQVVRPICKAVFTPQRPEDVPDMLREAHRLALSGRPGPVVLDLPFDVQVGALKGEEEVVLSPPDPAPPVDAGMLDQCVDALLAAERPLILAGGGVRGATARAACAAFVEAWGLPVATTIAALDVIDHGSPAFVGMPGTYGMRRANLSVTEADTVLVLGSRADHGVLGGDPKGFGRRRRIIRVDIDGGELSVRGIGDLGIQADVADFLSALDRRLKETVFAVPEAWKDTLGRIAVTHPDTEERLPGEGIDPNRFMAALGEASARAGLGAVCLDAGQHAWFTAQSLRLRGGARLISSTGLWSMGVGIPAGIGVALATGSPVLVVAGDAAVQLNIQELAVIQRLKLPVKVVVVDNRAQGMVRQFQDEFMEGRHHGTVNPGPGIDVTAVFAAHGIRGSSVSRPDRVEAALAALWAEPDVPGVLRVVIPEGIDVWPNVPFGRQIKDMRPDRSPAP